MPESNASISFTFAGLPGADAYCFSSFSRFALDIVSNMSGFLPGQYSTIIKSETEPAAADRGKDWHLLLPGGAPSGKIYSFFMGKWVTPHRIEPGSQERIWWTGTEAELWAYDGGDGTDPSVAASTPTATTGAMYEKDDDYDFRFPLQAGTSPAPTSTTVAPGDVGGAEVLTLTEAQLPEHSHAMFTDTIQVGSNLVGPNEHVAAQLQFSDSSYIMSKTLTAVDPALGITGAIGDGDAVNKMPPFRTGMWGKRTARVYETV